MSTFKVEKKKISKVWPHSNADRLDLASVEGIDYQFVVGKGRHEVGSEVVYFPIDSVLPLPLVEKIGLTGKLSGALKNRVKTVKLRGEISQGVVASLSEVFDSSIDTTAIQEDLTEVLGVTKYDSSEGESLSCRPSYLRPLPDGVECYDIEGVERHANVVQFLMTEKCFITEKIEGSNFALTIDSDDKLHVSTRNNSIDREEAGDHALWKLAEKKSLNARHVTLRGEVIGPKVQGNYYELTELKVLAFDLMVDFKYVGAEQFVRECSINSVEMVPMLAYNVELAQWLNDATIAEASTGRSKLVDRKLREGIVIKPMIEARAERFGRVVIKKRSPEYLEKTGK